MTKQFKKEQGINGHFEFLKPDEEFTLPPISLLDENTKKEKHVVGIDVPNAAREKIFLRDILESQEYVKSRSFLTLGLGKDLAGSPFVADLAKMPHLLLAGTGRPKYLAINAIIRILYKSTLNDVKFIMIDSNMPELSAYEDIPHLLTPIVRNPSNAAVVFRSIIREIDERYKLMAETGAKDIDKYNHLILETESEHKKMPYIVVLIDELADLMINDKKDIEDYLARLSQTGWTAGIHLIVATQKPTPDVIAEHIKANFPARILCHGVPKTDSITILDTIGAEGLLDEGDMLFLPNETARPQRIYGSYVSEVDVKRVAEYFKKQDMLTLDNEVLETRLDDGEFKMHYDEALNIATQMGQISTSYIQRRLRIDFITAARIIEKMEAEGVIGPNHGAKPREILLQKG